MNILITINFVTVVMALGVLFWRRKVVLAVVALFFVLLHGYGMWHAGVDVEDAVCRMLLDVERYPVAKAYPAAMGGWCSFIILNICMALYPWLRHWAVVLFAVLFFVVGGVVSMVSPLNGMEGLYAVCVAIMTEMATMTGQTYLDTCAIENIYLHSLLPTLFALPAFVAAAMAVRRKGSVWLVVITAIWLLLHVVLTVVVWRHYIDLSLTEASRKCIEELRVMANRTWNGYVIVNILIFVVIFLVDALLSWTLYRYVKRSTLLRVIS